MALFYSKGMRMTGRLYPTRFTGYDIQYWTNKVDGSKAVTLAMDSYRAKFLSKHKAHVDERPQGRRLPADPSMTDRKLEELFLKDPKS